MVVEVNVTVDAVIVSLLWHKAIAIIDQSALNGNYDVQPKHLGSKPASPSITLGRSKG